MTEVNTFHTRQRLESVTFRGSDLTGDDIPRLKGQLRRTYDAMHKQGWLTVEDVVQKIHTATGTVDKVTSIARQMRYLRDVDGMRLAKQHYGNGLFRYLLVEKQPAIATGI